MAAPEAKEHLSFCNYDNACAARCERTTSAIEWRPFLNMKGGNFVRRWVPAIIWMLVIFTASTDLGSVEHTSRFLIPFLQWINPHISGAAIMAAQFLIRKVAHLTEYAVLAILLLRALRSGTRDAFARQAILVLVIATLYAATDEFHQTFTPSRTASAHDVMIDCLGATVGLAIYWSMRRSPAHAAAGSIARTTP
jgi:VanZ family protein